MSTLLPRATARKNYRLWQMNAFHDEHCVDCAAQTEWGRHGYRLQRKIA
jgi:hypothetical protein